MKKLLYLIFLFNNLNSDYKKIDCIIRPYIRPGTKAIGQEKVSHPRSALLKSTSSNWCGFASVTNLSTPALNSVTSTTGSWNVPIIYSSRRSTYCAIWVGIDGYTSNTVEQIGTEHDWLAGRQINIAWFEMYPNQAYEFVNFPLKAGDSITASVCYLYNNIFLLALFNNSRKVYTVAPTSMTTMPGVNRSSAEWIVESPSSGTSTLPLAHFKTINLHNCTTYIKGLPGAISSSNHHMYWKSWTFDRIILASNSNITKAIPSGLSNYGQNFSVTWLHE